MLNESAPESDLAFSSEEQALISAWRDRDPNASELYDDWCANEETRVETGGRTDELQVAFEIRRGMLQYEAGFTEEAQETWSDVLAYVAKPSKNQTLIDLVQTVINSH